MNILYLYFALNNFTVYKSKKDYLLEKNVYTYKIKRNHYLYHFDNGILFSCKGYADVSKLFKTINEQTSEYL